MEKYYDINYTKQKLQEYLDNNMEVELCIRINNENYMIIPLRDKISFQNIGKTKEFYYGSVEELFNSNLVNDINLTRDWQKIVEIWFY